MHKRAEGKKGVTQLCCLSGHFYSTTNVQNIGTIITSLISLIELYPQKTYDKNIPLKKIFSWFLKISYFNTK